MDHLSRHTANERPVRIQYKCLFPIYVFPDMKLLFPKTELYCSVSHFRHSYICARFLYFQDRSAILLLGNMWTDPGNIEKAYRHINVEIGTEAAQFSEKEYINGIAVAVWMLQPSHKSWQENSART